MQFRQKLLSTTRYLRNFLRMIHYKLFLIHKVA